MSVEAERRLTDSQVLDLTLVRNGFVSSAMSTRMKPLVRRGLVRDLGLYDYDNHCKRYGSDRYKITPAGRARLA